MTEFERSPAQLKNGKVNQPYVWLSEMTNGFTFGYKIDPVQLTFLQMLSRSAVQNVTYHCSNSVAYLDASAAKSGKGAKVAYSKAIKLLASNDVEVTAEGHPNFVYNVIKDGCQVSLFLDFCKVFTFI